MREDKRNDLLKQKSEHTRDLVLAALLLALAIVAQIVGRQFPSFSRLFVGPVVNAVLLLISVLTSLRFAIPAAILTPILAYAVGQLNPALAPMIPFIMVSNVIYVVIFSLANEKRWQAILFGLIASVSKYLFFVLTVHFFLDIFKISFPEKIQANLPIAFGITQLITALIGLAIALACLEILPRKWQNKTKPADYYELKADHQASDASEE